MRKRFCQRLPHFCIHSVLHSVFNNNNALLHAFLLSSARIHCRPWREGEGSGPINTARRERESGERRECGESAKGQPSRGRALPPSSVVSLLPSRSGQFLLLSFKSILSSTMLLHAGGGVESMSFALFVELPKACALGTPPLWLPKNGPDFGHRGC